MRDALQGCSAGDELIVLTWLHEADRHVLQVHPRDDVARPLTGVFAHTHRPIGRTRSVSIV